MSDNQLIAVIDDDASCADAVGSLVRSFDFAVQTFGSAEEFLNWPRRKEVACLICDVRMPGMCGGELYELLVAEGSQMPVIFMTACSQESIRARAGDDASVLRKPFRAAELAIHLKKKLHAA